jgi:hypothetical protein
MSNGPICPCDQFVFPQVINNPPGLGSIAYRVGDFTTFRHALLLARPGEVELRQWRPNSPQDLAVQLVEWWAYLADILTFYNERIANQDYVRTADLPESLNRLIRVLGYRPRPGIGAVGTLAALLSKPVPLRLPQGFQIQSKPGPGEQPQVFELDADTTISPPDAVSVDPAPDPSLLQTDASGSSGVLLAGTVSGVKQGDELIMLERGWAGPPKHWALVAVSAVSQHKDAHGNTNTRIAFTATPALPTGARAADYRLLKSNQFTRPWQAADPSVTLQSQQVHLDSIARGIKVADPVLFEIPGGSPGPMLVSVTSYTEAVWYANAADKKKPDVSPDPTKTVPIPIPHSEITFKPPQTSNWPLDQVALRYAWEDVGQLISAPASTLSASAPALSATPPATLPPGNSVPIMIEDANGLGGGAFGSVVGPPPTMQLSGLPESPVTLTPPLRVLYGLMQVSRGKTITNEFLGSGDATQAGQEFVLKNSPLTYLLSASSKSGQNYRSTLVVRVDDVAWEEVPSFYGQPADAAVFVTREDESNATHVMFGDGINGARLPSGTNNVVAKYRFGSGAKSPPAGSLTVVLQPQPNLKAVRNPVAVGGGADPDPPDQIRRYAPQSALTFGRAISADDYETIAAQAPGVARARSYWAWNPDQQRALVAIYVGDDANAVKAAQTAIALADDPNRPVVVKLATPVPAALTMTLLIDPKYDSTVVTAGVRSALIDPLSGLFGTSLRIGQTLYDSQIYKACLSVAGAVAVHGLQFEPDGAERHFPGESGFFQLADGDLIIEPEVAANVG